MGPVFFVTPCTCKSCKLIVYIVPLKSIQTYRTRRTIRLTGVGAALPLHYERAEDYNSSLSNAL